MQKITRKFVRGDLHIPPNEDGTYDAYSDIEYGFYVFCLWVTTECTYSVYNECRELFGGEHFIFTITYTSKDNKVSGKCKFCIPRTLRIGKECIITKTSYIIYDMLKANTKDHNM